MIKTKIYNPQTAMAIAHFEVSMHLTGNSTQVKLIDNVSDSIFIYDASKFTEAMKKHTPGLIQSKLGKTFSVQMNKEKLIVKFIQKS